MPQLLLELFSEEIPARMQGQAARDLERMARDRLGEAGLISGGLKAFAGPRRLTLVAEGLPPAQPDRTEERKGPRINAPDQAVDGFLRSTGLTRDQLVQRDGVYFAVIARTGRPTVEIVAEMVEAIVRGFPWPKSMTSGTSRLRWVRPLRRILCVFDGEVVPFAIDGIESGDVTEGHRFMGSKRPFHARTFDQYVKALADNAVLLDAAERRERIADGARTLCFARNLELVEDAGLLDEVSGLAEWPTPIMGQMDAKFLDLPAEVIRTSMRTHQKYFAVRPMGGGEALAPNFIAVANIEAPDGGAAIAAGNARVLSARLNDARFFWDEDNKSGNFDRWLEKLKGVTFHAKLGTMFERVERIEALAREIAPLVGADPDVAARAARLCKADLASGMVGEFPELQGVMGRYYALAASDRGEAPGGTGKAEALPLDGGGAGVGVAPSQERAPAGADRVPSGSASTPNPGPSPIQGEGREIADAIRDHYKPQGPNDAVPTAPVSVAVALADKIDTLVGFFAIDEKPTGSRDPYALRRAALGVIRIVLDRDLRIRLAPADASGPLFLVYKSLSYQRSASQLFELHDAAVSMYERFGTQLSLDPQDVTAPGGREFWHGWSDARRSLLAFIADRLKVLLRDEGKRHDLVDAVFALGDDDLVRIVARIEALSVFLATEDGANLLAGYRRAANILKAEEKKGTLPADLHSAHASHSESAVQPVRMPGAPAEETALIAALEAVTPQVETDLAAEQFGKAMAALSTLRAPVDAFFDRVLVNADDAAVRENRLRLLAAVRAAMDRVADFAQVAG